MTMTCGNFKMQNNLFEEAVIRRCSSRQMFCSCIQGPWNVSEEVHFFWKIACCFQVVGNGLTGIVFVFLSYLTTNTQALIALCSSLVFAEHGS